jgi:hypothetical protein
MFKYEDYTEKVYGVDTRRQPNQEKSMDDLFQKPLLHRGSKEIGFTSLSIRKDYGDGKCKISVIGWKPLFDGVITFLVLLNTFADSLSGNHVHVTYFYPVEPCSNLVYIAPAGGV